MKNNSNLLKEAIADAKAVRATALANAKASLSEAFSKRFEAVFADKLREDSSEEVDNTQPPMAETVEPKDAKPSKSDGAKGWSAKNTDSAGKSTAKNITPNTVPSAKDGGDATKGWSKDNKGNAMDGTPNGIKENSTEVAEENVEESVTNEDLEEIIRELEAEAGNDTQNPDMGSGTDVGAGADVGNDLPPSEPTPDVSTAGAGTPIMAGTPVILQPAPAGGATASVPEVPEAPMAPEAPGAGDSSQPEPEMEEEVNLEELLASLNEEAKEDDEKEEDEKEECEEKEKKEVDETISAENTALKSQLSEAISTVEYLRKQINEINLLNAKLLYTNKLFKEFGVNRDQKIKIVEAFDLTNNVREVKLTYANWCESLNFGGNLKKKTISNSTIITEGLASRTVASTKPSEIITENVSDMAFRFKQLAGIKTKK